MSENVIENLPTTKKIEEGLEAAKKEIREVSTAPGIDSTGQQILSDTEQVLSSAEKLLREKNEGDKLQELLREGQKASEELQRQAEILKQEGTPVVDTEGLKDLAEKTLETARLAGIELVSSESFRKSLTDFGVLFYDIIAEAAIETGFAGKETQSPKKIEGERQTTTAKPKRAELKKKTTPSKITPPVSDTAKPPAKDIKPAVAESLEGRAQEGIESAINKGLEATGTTQKVSKEKINELVERFMDILKNISERERTRNVFLGLLDMLKFFGQQVAIYGENVANKAERSAAALRYNRHVIKTLTLARELFERFTGDKSLDQLIYHLQKIDKVIRKDPETLHYFEGLRDYVVELLNHPELFADSETGKRGRRLIKRGTRLHDKKLKNHLRGLLEETKAIVYKIQNDPATMKLRDDMKKLIQDVMLDEQGNVILKEDVLEQLRVIIVSSMIQKMRLPIPTIHMEDDDMEYTLNNLVVSFRDLVPEKMILENRSAIALDFGNKQQPEVEAVSSTIRLFAQNINIHIEQADIFFHRKTFPRVTDQGKLRLDIGGKGLDLAILLETHVGSRNFFTVKSVDCDVHTFSFILSDTRHDWLYNSVLNLMSGRVQRGMERSIENTLINHLEQLNKMLLKQLHKARELTKDVPSSESTFASVSKVGKDILSSAISV